MSDHDHESLHDLASAFHRHASEPANLGPLDHPDGVARMVGKCGDAITMEIQLTGDEITAVGIQPEGCAFTRACASGLSEMVLHTTLEKALKIEPEDLRDVLGGLPDDHMHCARLAVNTLGGAIEEAMAKQATGK